MGAYVRAYVRGCVGCMGRGVGGWVDGCVGLWCLRCVRAYVCTYVGGKLGWWEGKWVDVDMCLEVFVVCGFQAVEEIVGGGIMSVCVWV